MRVSRPGAASAAGLRALALGDGPVALVTGLLSLSAEVAPGEAATLGAGWMSSTAAGRAAAWLGWTAFPVARATFWLAVVEYSVYLERRCSGTVSLARISRALAFVAGGLGGVPAGGPDLRRGWRERQAVKVSRLRARARASCRFLLSGRRSIGRLNRAIRTWGRC